MSFAEWELAGGALEDGLEPPVWQEYVASAHREMSEGNGTTGILNLAIAAESVIRFTIEKQIPAGMPEGLVDAIQRINISNIIAKKNKFEFHNLKDMKNIKLLFEIRNKIMHHGKDNRVTEGIFLICASSVRNLIGQLEASES